MADDKKYCDDMADDITPQPIYELAQFRVGY